MITVEVGTCIDEKLPLLMCKLSLEKQHQLKAFAADLRNMIHSAAGLVNKLYEEGDDDDVLLDQMCALLERFNAAMTQVNSFRNSAPRDELASAHYELAKAVQSDMQKLVHLFMQGHESGLELVEMALMFLMAAIVVALMVLLYVQLDSNFLQRIVRIFACSDSVIVRPHAFTQFPEDGIRLARAALEPTAVLLHR